MGQIYRLIPSSCRCDLLLVLQEQEQGVRSGRMAGVGVPRAAHRQQWVLTLPVETGACWSTRPSWWTGSRVDAAGVGRAGDGNPRGADGGVVAWGTWSDFAGGGGGESVGAGTCGGCGGTTLSLEVQSPHVESSQRAWPEATYAPSRLQIPASPASTNRRMAPEASSATATALCRAGVPANASCFTALFRPRTTGPGGTWSQESP
jgi:hypothetical protein